MSKKWGFMNGGVILAVATAIVIPTGNNQAHAQALPPVVDVCTGVTLPRSAVTDIIGRVNAPIVAPIEGTVNRLTSLTSFLGLTPDLNIDLTSILADAAAGDPISLQVLDTDGNIVGPSDDCNVAADNISLNEQSGISIGGNQISGLGANGEAASAGELDAIAFGNNASTAPGATGAVAIGTNASATAADSVAIGANSVADRSGTVSVGAPGSERQIVNVADGTAATDAATVGQVDTAIAAATANAVEYNGPAQDLVTLQGADGTTITNLADGTVAAGSSDAVNGSQLFATNQDVAGNTLAIGALDTRVADNEGDIIDLGGRVTVNEGAISDLQDSGVMYDDASRTSVTLAGAGGTIVSNLADGAISATSTDAVNGAQLFATNQEVGALDSRVATNAANIADVDVRVTANDVDIASLDGRVSSNEGAISDLQDTSVMYDDATRTSVTLGGAGGTRLSNVSAGTLDATSTEAVNGSQLFATNQAVDALDTRVGRNEADIASNTTAIANLQTTSGNFDNRITQNETQIAEIDGRVTNIDNRVTNIDDRVTEVDGRVTVNAGAIVDLDGRVTTNETDIVNLDNRTTAVEGDVSDLDNRVTVNESTIVDLDGRVTVNEADIANNQGDIATLDNRITTTEENVVAIDNRVAVNESDITTIQTRLDNAPVTYVSDADRTTPSTEPTNTAAFTGADGGTVSVTNVADAELSASSTDAVNGRQLNATNLQVAGNTDEIERLGNSLAGSTIVAVQYSNPDNPTASNGGTITNDVTLLGADSGSPVVLHNVANGTLANDAANIGQLQAGLANTMAGSMDYTDSRVAEAIAYTDMQVDDLRFDLSDLREDAFSGTAAAMAIGSIPQAIEASQSMVGGGVGHYRGETAFSFGYSRVSGNGNTVFQVSGTVDMRGKGGVAAGAGISF